LSHQGKASSPDGFTTEEVIPILKLLQHIEKEEILPNIFYMASIILIVKPDRDTIYKDHYRPIP
jgi:hypothetical protein